MSNTIQAGILGEVDLDAIFRTGITLVILYSLSALGHLRAELSDGHVHPAGLPGNAPVHFPED